MEQIQPIPIEMPGRYMTQEEAAADRAVSSEDRAYFLAELERIQDAERAAYDLTE